MCMCVCANMHLYVFKLLPVGMVEVVLLLGNIPVALLPVGLLLVGLLLVALLLVAILLLAVLSLTLLQKSIQRLAQKSKVNKF